MAEIFEQTPDWSDSAERLRAALTRLEAALIETGSGPAAQLVHEAVLRMEALERSAKLVLESPGHFSYYEVVEARAAVHGSLLP